MKLFAEPFLFPWPGELVPAIFIRRRVRFFADVQLEDGREVVAHCVNSGRMEGMIVPGARVWITPSPNPENKLRWTWQLAEIGGRFVGANTIVPNRLVGAMLRAGAIPGFTRYPEVLPEQKYGKHSRIDFLLRGRGGEHYVEVKNVHLVYPDSRGYFPDSVSERATGHLHELMAMVKQGHRASVMFVVQRADARGVRPSDAHDPAFAKAARKAVAAGVDFKALLVEPSLEGVRAVGMIPVDLRPYATERHTEWREVGRAESGWVMPKRGAGKKKQELTAENAECTEKSHE